MGIAFETASIFFGWRKHGMKLSPSYAELTEFWHRNPEGISEMRLRTCSNTVYEAL